MRAYALSFDCSAIPLPVIKFPICIPYVSTEVQNFSFSPDFIIGKTMMDVKTTMVIGKVDLFLSVGFLVWWKVVYTTYHALGGKDKACRTISTLSSWSQT
jgi:hypothetical protein